jgi:4-diphosphocytidyl-2-C-methyl-D-erythritol kinase
MQALYDLPAPAKLNLFLHITGRRSDGYHLLQSVFMLVDVCDTLHIELRRDGVISREDIGAGSAGADLPADDLCVRAARALQQAAGVSLGCHIALQKRIPQQAGMGGGSSDAATCLLALQRLWNVREQLSDLEQIGMGLGADVPFFLRGRNAWVEGVGEQITPVELPAQEFVVLKPPVGLDTRVVFSSTQLKRDTKTATIQGFAANTSASNSEGIWNYGRNDLEPVARSLCPDVGASLEWLKNQGLQGRMTGSGSAVFAPLPDPGVVLESAPQGSWLQRCSNLQVHPLWGW